MDAKRSEKGRKKNEGWNGRRLRQVLSVVVFPLLLAAFLANLDRLFLNLLKVPFSVALGFGISVPAAEANSFRIEGGGIFSLLRDGKIVAEVGIEGLRNVTVSFPVKFEGKERRVRAEILIGRHPVIKLSSGGTDRLVLFKNGNGFSVFLEASEVAYLAGRVRTVEGGFLVEAEENADVTAVRALLLGAIEEISGVPAGKIPHPIALREVLVNSQDGAVSILAKETSGGELRIALIPEKRRWLLLLNDFTVRMGGVPVIVSGEIREQGGVRGDLKIAGLVVDLSEKSSELPSVLDGMLINVKADRWRFLDRGVRLRVDGKVVLRGKKRDGAVRLILSGKFFVNGGAIEAGKQKLRVQHGTIYLAGGNPILSLHAVGNSSARDMAVVVSGSSDAPVLTASSLPEGGMGEMAAELVYGSQWSSVERQIPASVLSGVAKGVSPARMLGRKRASISLETDHDGGARFGKKIRWRADATPTKSVHLALSAGVSDFYSSWNLSGRFRLPGMNFLSLQASPGRARFGFSIFRPIQL